MLETVAAARGTTAIARIETEGADRVAALLCHGLGRKQFADRIEGTDIARGIRTRRAADRRLVDHDDGADVLRSVDGIDAARGFCRLAEMLAQRGIQDVLDQRRLAGTGDAGDGDELLQRDLDIDALQIVLAGAADAD